MLAEANPRPGAPPAGARDRSAPAPSGAAADDEADRARAWLDVDLGALARNARRVRDAGGVPLLPMVKAEAYGLGALPVARALAALDPWGFGVASVAEGAALRAGGVTGRVVVFTPLLAPDLPRARAHGLTPTLHRADDVHAWASLGGGPWHLAVDTGMSRAGVRWDALGGDLLDAAAAAPPEGAYTHLHSADEAGPAAERVRREQEDRFRAAVARLPARPAVLHAENGPAIERSGRSAWDLARPGLYLYGGSCVDRAAGAVLPAPEPVAHLRARVVDVRDVAAGEAVSYGATWRAAGPRRVATAAAGYADGYRRAYSNRGVALLHGVEVPVVGRVTMDMTMLDVTGVTCGPGDVVTLVGRDGDRVLTVDAVAARGDLSPYELLAGLRLRVPHRYGT
jgi:alanine racemase